MSPRVTVTLMTAADSAVLVGLALSLMLNTSSSPNGSQLEVCVTGVCHLIGFVRSYSDT